MIAYTQEGGWNGGRFLYNGLSCVDFENMGGGNPTPVVGTKAVLKSEGVDIRAEVVGFNVVTGVDYDHGHRYDWSYNEPMFQFEGCPFPIPASAVWKQGFQIFLEVS